MDRAGIAFALLSAAALVLAGGRLGDTVGRVRAVDIGLVVFAAGPLVGVVVSLIERSIRGARA